MNKIIWLSGCCNAPVKRISKDRFNVICTKCGKESLSQHNTIPWEIRVKGLDKLINKIYK